MSAEILRYALGYAQIALIIALALACWRMLRGPRAQDRVLAMDTMYMNAMLLFLVVGMAMAMSSSLRARWSSPCWALSPRSARPSS